MDPRNQLRFAVDDKIGDQDVRPDHVPLALLGEFQKDVSEFLRGSKKDVALSDVVIAIEEGSLAFVASGLLAITGLWHDLAQLQGTNSLADIDQKRAQVLLRWQAAAHSHPSRKYHLQDSDGRTLVNVNSESILHTVSPVWVRVEKYVHGKIHDMGGKAKPNIHIELEDGQSITVSATQDQIAAGERNRMYRDELLRISAEENLSTGELRHVHLIAFEHYHPRYDEDEFNRMVEQGTRAWSDVGDDWLDSLRGDKE